ncbi:aspartate/glutamate racemase family protein [Xanthobacteraceae bacterium A53D]
MSAKRLLIINPNTSDRVTAILREAACRMVPPHVEVRAVTAPFGAASLECAAELAIAGHAVLEALAANADCHAVIIGAFGDPGLEAAREISPVPVFGLASSGIRAAAGEARPFAIVTLGPALVPSIRRTVRDLGAADQLVALRLLEASVLDVAADRAGFLSAMAEAADQCAADGAQAVLFGGAPFAGIGTALAGRVDVPILDGLTCAVEDALAAPGHAPPQQPATPAAGKSRPGISPALSLLIDAALTPSRH